MSTRESTAQPWGSLLAAAFSYIIWGLFPLYWKQLAAVDPLELIAHRMLWALVLLIVIVLVQRRARELLAGLSDPKMAGTHLLSGALLTVNWLVYVWGVNTGHVIECSLGYFLVPLINVLLGRFVLGERLRPAQGVAIGCATAGVLAMIWIVGRPPWIALALAGTFGLYGLIRKRATFGPLMGLTAETLLCSPFAVGVLLWRTHQGVAALGQVGTGTTLLLLSTGAVTAVPLLLFAKGARGLRLTTMGLLQYLAPTCQFLLGWLAYGEPLSSGRALAFGFIWAGLAIYSADALWSQRPRAAGGVPAPASSR